MKVSSNGKTQSKCARLKALIYDPKILVVPGVFDGFSCRVVQAAGFEHAAISGAGTSESRLGKPDVGIMGLEDNLAGARAMASCVDIPLLADGDTGYGNAINVYYTVQAFERAGVAGLMIEDQKWPKRCGHMAGKEVIEADEMVQKVRAAVDARQDPDFVIIARTDANAVNGLEDALRRGRAYREAGADVIFIEAPRSIEELQAIAQAFPNTPLLFNWAESGKTPLLTLNEIHTLGFKLVIFPVSLLFAATRAMLSLLEVLKQGETPASFSSQTVTFSQFTQHIGLPEIQGLERRYGVNSPTVDR